MRRLAATLTLTAALVPVATAQTPTTTSRGPGACEATYTRGELVRHVRRTMRSPVRLSRARGRRLHQRIGCAASPNAARAARRELRHLRAWRRSYAGIWATRVPRWLHQVLRAIAGCESHGDPRAIGGGGLYRGKYQFDYGTWAAGGGHGDPAAAPEREQDVRAARLYRQRGAQPWPVCGR